MRIALVPQGVSYQINRKMILVNIIYNILFDRLNNFALERGTRFMLLVSQFFIFNSWRFRKKPTWICPRFLHSYKYILKLSSNCLYRNLSNVPSSSEGWRSSYVTIRQYPTFTILFPDYIPFCFPTTFPWIMRQRSGTFYFWLLRLLVEIFLLLIAK